LQKNGGKSLVFLRLLVLSAFVVLIFSGCGAKKSPVSPVAAVVSDACILCHISPEAIDMMHVPPEVAAGGGG